MAIVVDEYVKKVTPVGSGLIAKRYFLDASPATIRNILAELEEEGYFPGSGVYFFVSAIRHAVPGFLASLQIQL